MPKSTRSSSSTKAAAGAARSIAQAARSVAQASRGTTKAARAPAGAGKVANGLARFVKSFGKQAAADAYGTSVGNVSKLLNARAAGKLGKAIGSVNVLKAWTGRETVARQNVSRTARRVIDGKAAPSGRRKEQAPRPAPTKAGKAGQEMIGKIRATRTDKSMAEALGISRQKATAERKAIERGTADAATVKRWADADRRLGKTLQLKRGMLIANKAQGARYKKAGGVSRNKKFRTLKQAKEWIDAIAAGRGYFRIVNMGTPERPRYDVIFGDEKALAEVDAAAGFDLNALHDDEGEE